MASAGLLLHRLAYDRLLVAGATAYVYDRMLTIGKEVDLVWRRERVGFIIPILFVSMHLFTVLLLVLDIAFIVPPQTCERRVSVVTRRCRSSATDQLPISYYKLYIAAGIVFCFLYLVWGAASALRAFAINGRKYGLPAMVMAVSLLPVVTNVLNLATIYVVPVPPPSNCAILSKASTPVMRKFEIATRVSAMLVDAMVVLATWQVTGGIRSLAKGIDINVPTTRRLLRDGTIYFFILLLVNALVLALYISPVSFADSNMAMLSDVATTILLSRLFLNLREATFGPTDSAFSGTSQTCDCARRFAPAVGPLGISKIANELDDATGRDDEDLIEDLASTSYAVEEGIASGVAHCPAGCTSREHGDPSEVVESHPMALP